MTTPTNTLLVQARDCLSALIDSSFLDAKEMANDCLEAFDTYEWKPKSDLSETDGVRWVELHQKGNDGKLGDEELSEFLELTTSEGQTHPYYHRIQARKLVDSIQEYEERKADSENHQLAFTLKDECGRKEKDINGFVDNKINLGIALHFSGYSDFCSADDNGTPVYIEKYDGDLRVIIYADINQEEPTHVISLESARVEKREEA